MSNLGHMFMKVHYVKLSLVNNINPNSHTRIWITKLFAMSIPNWNQPQKV